MTADDPENLTLVYLRRLDTKMDRLIDDVADLKTRMTGVEEAVSGQSRRIDRVESRLDHIERRLNLAS
jgi:predicted  nucleic acid-binding Zn-ribbon protein